MLYDFIKLGAFLQKYFNMLDGFNVIEAPPDRRSFLVAPNPILEQPIGAQAIYDDVELEAFIIPNTNRMILCGYSRTVNVLVIAEYKGKKYYA